MSPRGRAARPRAARTLRRRALEIQSSRPERRWGCDAPPSCFCGAGHMDMAFLSIPHAPRPRAPRTHLSGTRAKTRGHSGACPGASRHQPRASPSAPSRLPPHRPATLRARLPVTCPLSRPRGAPGPPSGTRHGPGGCSPRASRAVGAQKSKLYVHTHAAVAPWGATRSLTLWSPNPTPKATGTRQSHSHTYLKAQSGRAGLGGGNSGCHRIKRAASDQNTQSRLGSLPFQHSTRAHTRPHSRAAFPPPS